MLPPMVVRKLCVLSDEILGPSDTGDLIDSHLALVREALIDLGMHFVRVEPPSSVESNCSVVLQSQMIFLFQ